MNKYKMEQKAKQEPKETAKVVMNSFMTDIKSKMKEEFLRIVTQMTTEFDLAFDFVDKKSIDQLEKYKARLEKETQYFEEQVKSFVDLVRPYKEQLAHIASASKVKSSEYDFLNNLKLFEDILDFSLFKDENKNTKRSIVKYINSMYLSGTFLALSLDSNNDTEGKGFESLSSELTSFIQAIQEKKPPIVPKRDQQVSKQVSSRQLESQGLDSIINTMFANPDIMKMATELSQDLQEQQIDPMTIMSSLMSGRPDPQMNNLINNLTAKIENGINSGNIDKDALQRQAAEMMNAIDTSELASQLQGLGLPKK